MLNKKLLHIIDNFVERHILPLSITLLIHLFFIGILIIFEMSKPQKTEANEIIIDFAQEELKEEQIMNNESNYNDEDNSKPVKNVAKNLADKNQSEKDYYTEAKELLNSAKGKELFKAQDYNDLRWLIKDYSKTTPDIENWNVPENKLNNEKNSSSTFSGNAIISYDLGGRRAVYLPVPAYRCIGYGKVSIEIIVNKKGEVTQAKILQVSTSLSENCLPQSALEAAYRSRFQSKFDAPDLQKGYIYYTFVAQ